MSLESPCQAQFLGFDSNDGARAQMATAGRSRTPGLSGKLCLQKEKKPTTPHKLLKKVLAQESLVG